MMLLSIVGSTTVVCADIQIPRKPEVWVDVDQKDHHYVDGEFLEIDVFSNTDGFLYLIHRNQDGEETVLFPNQQQRNNRISANQPFYFPGESANFRMQVHAPFGLEEIQAFVTKQPISLSELVSHPSPQVGPDSVMESKEATEIAESLIFGGYIQLGDLLMRQKKVLMHHVCYTTSEKIPLSEQVSQEDTTEEAFVSDSKNIENTTALPAHHRYALCIGIDQYQDTKIRSLSDICVNDAQAMADFLVRSGQVLQGDCIVLTNEQATLENVRSVFCEVLPLLVTPGNEIVITWSGHGYQMTQEDGTSEVFLVPYDGDISRSAKETTLTSSLLSKWLEGISDCRVLLLVDASYGGKMLSNTEYSGTSQVMLIGPEDLALGDTTSSENSVFTHNLLQVLSRFPETDTESLTSKLQEYINLYIEENDRLVEVFQIKSDGKLDPPMSLRPENTENIR